MENNFFVKTNGGFTRISLTDILLVEARRNYVKIITENRSHLVLLTMKRMEELLPPGQFRRIHRSFIVNLDRVEEFDQNSAVLCGRTVPVSEQYRSVLPDSLVIVS